MVLTFQSATSSRSIGTIDLQGVFWKTKTLTDDIVSIQGFNRSIGGKPVVEKTANGRITGDRNKNLKRVDVRFSFKGAFASVRENTVNLSGSVAWEKIRNALVRLVPEVKSLAFTVTNTAVKFNLKKSLRLEHIERRLRSMRSLTVEYEPERFAGLRVKFENGILANIFANGTVTAQGRNLDGFEKRLKDLLEKTVGSPYKIGAREMSASPIAARRNLGAKRAAMTESRYEPANGWNNVRPGFYVRPGPNKVARFYAVPKNPALVRTKVMRAYANLGVNIPLETRRILGISVSAGAVKPKMIAKKTVSNWNVSPPPGMYIRPGPGGLPKFYKVPKLLKQGKKTVVEAYTKAGVNIPNKVRAVFGISPRGSPLSKAPKLNITNKGVFRIDGLECTRYKLEDLKQIAKRMDIPVLKRKKDDLCRDIRKKMSSKSPAVNFIKNDVKHYILLNEKRVKRNRHIKAMNSFKIQELKEFIKELNRSANTNGKTKKELVELLIERKRMKNTLANMNFNFSASSSNGSPLSPPGRAGINIAKNILGPGFTNAQLQNFLNKYSKSPQSLNRIVGEFKGLRVKKLANAPTESL